MGKVPDDVFATYLRSNSSATVDTDHLIAANAAADRAIDNYCARRIYVWDSEDAERRGRCP